MKEMGKKKRKEYQLVLLICFQVCCQEVMQKRFMVTKRTTFSGDLLMSSRVAR